MTTSNFANVYNAIATRRNEICGKGLMMHSGFKRVCCLSAIRSGDLNAQGAIDAHQMINRLDKESKVEYVTVDSGKYNWCGVIIDSYKIEIRRAA